MKIRLLPWRSAAPALLGLAACAPNRPPELPAPARFSMEVRQILNHRESSPDFFRARSRIEQMGPEVDAILVSLARDPDAKTLARGNALLLLADRRSPAAISVLRRVILAEPDEEVRAMAVLALQRLAAESEEASNLIRAAVSDPSRAVRLNALQVLDVRDITTLRALVEHEPDPEVRHVAVQLIAIFESRGAPLAPDRRGALRTAGDATDPQIVFRPVRADTISDLAVGDLRIELPNAPDIALAPLAEVVGRVVPAFFAPDRSRAVYEVDREIRTVNLANHHMISLGPGIAPRVIPFSNDFVFLRPVADAGTELPDATELHYEVFRAGFDDTQAKLVGEMTATARPERHANYSPVRWMAVGESPNGFVLRGDGVSTFPLSTPPDEPLPQEPAPGQNRPGGDR
jgi:hypothetical protein